MSLRIEVPCSAQSTHTKHATHKFDVEDIEDIEDIHDESEPCSVPKTSYKIEEESLAKQGIFEPMLFETKKRWVLFPIQYHNLWDMYKKARAANWEVEHVDLSQDMQHFVKLKPDEQYFLKHVLGFFAASDGIVNENLLMNFASEVQFPEARSFYTQQIAIENIHAEMYSLLLDTYIQDREEKTRMFNAIETVPCIKRKAEWALRWTNSEVASFAERLVAFAAVEGIFFSGSFCAIYWMKKRGLMPGLTFANEYIARDEGMHCKFACMLFHHLERKLPEQRIREILMSAVENEITFITSALPVRLIGMNADSMVEYIKVVANKLAEAFEIAPIYNAKNPFPWMVLISLEGVTNFFERKVGEYKKNGVQVDGDDKKTFDADVDF